jgi:hypothetical protein
LHNSTGALVTQNTSHTMNTAQPAMIAAAAQHIASNVIPSPPFLLLIQRQSAFSMRV